MNIVQGVTELVYEILDDVNAELPEESQVDKTLEAGLFGGDSKLDSFALVNLIVAVEQRVNEEYGKVITLADEKAMSRKSSPFRTVGSLVDYIVFLLGNP